MQLKLRIKWNFELTVFRISRVGPVISTTELPQHCMSGKTRNLDVHFFPDRKTQGICLNILKKLLLQKEFTFNTGKMFEVLEIKLPSDVSMIY